MPSPPTIFMVEGLSEMICRPSCSARGPLIRLTFEPRSKRIRQSEAPMRMFCIKKKESFSGSGSSRYSPLKSRSPVWVSITGGLASGLGVPVSVFRWCKQVSTAQPQELRLRDMNPKFA